MDVLEIFSTHSREALRKAFAISQRCGSVVVEPEHLLCGIAQQRGSLGADLLAKAEITPESIEQALAIPPTVPATVPSQKIKISERLRRCIERATLLSSNYGHRYVGTEHLLGGVLELADEPLRRLLGHRRVSPQQLQERITVVFKSTSKFPELAEALDTSQPPRDDEALGAALPRTASREPASALENFATELTDPRFQHRLDPLIGRHAELERIIHILCRRTKNNPLLLGDPGVGKTAIVEGLARAIVQGKVPEALHDARIYRLDVGLLVAGASFRGEFEQRFKQLIVEIKNRPEVILFIDELHVIVGAGSASGAMDAANLMKPALARGEIRCIGATTLEDFKRHIEHDAALERRFQPILVRQPDVPETIAILKGLRERYERFHGVKISDDAVAAAATLADRYLTGKFMPDKAIDILDEAAASRKVSRAPGVAVARRRAAERELKELLNRKALAVSGEHFEEALRLRNLEEALRGRLAQLQRHAAHPSAGNRQTVGAREIHQVISRMTGVELTLIRAGERQQLQRLEHILTRRVLGQTDAVRKVSEIIRRARTGIANARRPVGSFLFLGPSGVGKTELARVLADAIFGGADALIRLDMSEFAEGFNISRLIGSPAGYVGYRETAQLTDAVRKHPHSVVLFDEIEKAHPQVLTLLLQILEDGLLTDATGKTVNFRNAVIVMTSNFGTDQLLTPSALGFGSRSGNDNERQTEMERKLIGQLDEQFPIELLNRIDQIVVFNPLSPVTVARIVRLQLQELGQRIADQGRTLRWSPAVTRLIAAASYSPEQGARAVRREIQEQIETPIAMRLLRVKQPKHITVGVRNGKIVVR
ncbi:MAG: ATP-dependent Clp protease ATP-binding subunit [Patescibacteria group bacterium]|nr:ATP-dependent Clp protease ATP-binding subunit [Patescibacteria group bacterium]